MAWVYDGVEKTGKVGLRIARGVASFRADVSFALVDALLVVVAYSGALMLRFVDLPEGVPPHWWQDFLVVLPIIVAVHVIANIVFGAYGHVWQFASIAEAVKIVLANGCAAVVLLASMMAYRAVSDQLGPMPVGSLALGALLTLTLMGAVRFRSRLFSFNRFERAQGTAPRSRIVIVGTGKPAVDLARHLSAHGGGSHVVGFVGEPPAGNGRHLAGLPVLGSVDSIPQLVNSRGIDEVIVATRHGSSVVRRLVDLCLSVEVRIRIVPDIDSVLEGNGVIQDVRDLEPDDLLDRASVHTDLQQVAALLEGSTVMVTGAGGSIGSELVRQILTFGPSRVLALDHDETHLHVSMLNWKESGVEIEPILCDIRDRSRLLRVFATYRPQIVFHAAAHKHVPILESSPEEAVKTNVLGTMVLIEAAKRSGTDRFVLISTDKAADPVGVMGASKRVAEMLVQSEAAASEDVHFSAVRFGNVLGSRGSVVPTFVEQIEKGLPVTVTDSEMTRYFMTGREAVELVLQAAAIAGDGQVLVLDMGEPVKIVDLAHRLIRMAGLVPGRDIEVRYTGRRPGERLHEMLSVVPLTPSTHPRISIADPGFPGPVTLMDTMMSLVGLAAKGDRDGLRETLLSVARRDWQFDSAEIAGPVDQVVDLRDEIFLPEPALDLGAVN
ncbi:MAG TPA: nucleoside-diphosphate sugar epimerase/dehydratase [Acidimicrobiia bacterium]|nr:nucleoside-diphosphate sugar epimerase/dehydratase [Acidimicrobiia bacterium]